MSGGKGGPRPGSATIREQPTCPTWPSTPFPCVKGSPVLFCFPKLILSSLDTSTSQKWFADGSINLRAGYRGAMGVLSAPASRPCGQSAPVSTQAWSKVTVKRSVSVQSLLPLGRKKMKSSCGLAYQWGGPHMLSQRSRTVSCLCDTGLGPLGAGRRTSGV